MAKAKSKQSSDPHHAHQHHLPANGSSKAPAAPKTDVVVICSKCQRVSQKFAAYDKDLAFNSFVENPSVSYGYCQCNEYWRTGLVIRNPDLPEAKVVILTAERDRLQKALNESKLRIESYERAMSLMSGAPFALRMGPGY